MGTVIDTIVFFSFLESRSEVKISSRKFVKLLISCNQSCIAK